MKRDVILAGVGGQGIISIATVVGYIAVNDNLYLKQSEVHGMSQRGGDVQSHLRISDREIAADVIPKGKADMILSVEPMESLRYLPWLSPDGWIITNTTPYVNVANYPDLEKILAEIARFPRNIAFDAETIAKEAGSVRSANMVILGAASPLFDFPVEKFEHAMEYIFGKKGGKVIQFNLKAFHAGREIALKKIH